MSSSSEAAVARVSVVLFAGFELLDVFGPVELFSLVPGFEVEYLAASASPVASSQGARVVPTRTLADAEDSGEALDILLVPGGPGTRTLVDDGEFLGALARLSVGARIVASVCTGSAVLAAAGLLEGRPATSNKRAFAWASSFGRDVDWRPRARWVADDDRWTSSGVAAGMDMAFALIAHLAGQEAAEAAASAAELEVRRDPARDPFAEAARLADRREPRAPAAPDATAS